MILDAQEKHRILDETIELYSDPANRAHENGKCKFITDDGRRCAIGRLLEPDLCLTIENLILEEDDDIAGASGMLFELLDNSFRDALRSKDFDLPDFLVQNEGFFEALQFLHDMGQNWERNHGLSTLGKEHVRFMRQSIAAGRI